MADTWDPSKFDPHAPEFLANPYPTYALFREQAPVFWLEEYKSWWVFRYGDVKLVVDEKETFLKNSTTPPATPTPIYHVLGNMPEGVFSLDPPQHDVVRGFLNPLFAQAIADGSATATALAKSLLVAAKQSRRFDFVSAYALLLPAEVLFTIMGIPQVDWPGLIGWVTAIVAAHDPTQTLSVQEAGLTCTMGLSGYYQALMRGCPLDPQHARLLDLMVQQAPRQGITLEEVQSTAVNFNVAGYQSTTFLIATGALNLLQQPDQLAKLRQNPGLMASAIEEMLRYDTPAQIVDRVAAQDVTLGGQKISAGETVSAVLGSANRDPGAFDDPDRFDITRSPNPHVAFGDGIHYCIGAPLVRMVAPAAFTVLLQELPSFSLAGMPQWQTDPYLRSVSNLPLAVG